MDSVPKPYSHPPLSLSKPRLSLRKDYFCFYFPESPSTHILALLNQHFLTSCLFLLYYCIHYLPCVIFSLIMVTDNNPEPPPPRGELQYFPMLCILITYVCTSLVNLHLHWTNSKALDLQCNQNLKMSEEKMELFLVILYRGEEWSLWLAV